MSDGNLPGAGVRAAFAKTWAASGTLSFIAGFIADVLQPLAPFATYLLLLSGLGVFICGVLALMSANSRGWAAPGAILSLCLLLFSGAIVGLQKAGGEQADDRGIVADRIPALAQIQQSLGLIQKDVTEIKETTTRIESTTGKIDEKTDKILVSIDKMSEAFTSLAKQGGVIANPESPDQFYHNARVYEQQGDYAKARQAYLGFFKSDLPFLDPHLRFQSFLKIQEGLAGARESYQYIANQSKTQVPKLAAILLQEPAQRKAQLEQFVSANPDFAPAFYLASQEYSLAKLGSQSLEDKRQEKAMLDQFAQLDDDGKFVKWFLDKDVVDEWRKDSEARLTALKTMMNEAALANPVTVTWQSSSAGWMGTVQIVEPTLEIFWKKPGGADFVSTGVLSIRNPQTGLPMPNPSLTLPATAPKGEFEVKYLNASNGSMGPFKLTFDPEASDLVSTKEILKLTANSWLSFRDYEGKVLLYFSQLVSYRGALKEIRYGLDKDVPDTAYDFPPHQGPPGVSPIPDGFLPYIEVPAATKFVSVQVTYRDGAKTDVIRIDR